LLHENKRIVAMKGPQAQQTNIKSQVITAVQTTTVGIRESNRAWAS